jgi:alcohol dehydrogenase, propanol-preferring
MKAQVLRQPNRELAAALALEDRPIPGPGPGQVLVKVSATAVCRTDLQLVTGDLPAHLLPVVPGHQVVGRIASLGADVTGIEPGDRVGLVWLAQACGVCRFCTSGRENLCTAAEFTGWDVDGGYAQYALATAAFVHPIPDSAVPATAASGSAASGTDDADVAVAPLLCGGVIGYRALRVAGIGADSSGQRLGLYGFGASASLAIQVARHFGVRCFVVTRSRQEAARAVELGAEWAGTYDESMPTRLDAAVTFAPVGSVVTDALRMLDRGGTVAINAIHLDAIPTIDYDDLWWERSIRSVANVTRSDVREFLDLIGPAGVRTSTEVLPLDEAATALQRLGAGDVTGSFVLLPPDSGRESPVPPSVA